MCCFTNNNTTKLNQHTTHPLHMSYSHKHQQQWYHNENTKLCMFMHYMYADTF